MALFSFYNMRKPRQFNHRPIYWDPRREALDERIRKVEIEMGVREETVEEYKPQIKGTFVQGMSHLRKSRAKGDDMRSRIGKNMKLLLILSILAVLFWYFFMRK
jgi:hypothetical protein